MEPSPAPEKYVGKHDFESAITDLGFRLGQIDSPTEALIITCQLEALVKEMKIWVNQFQADEMRDKELTAWLEERKTRGANAPLRVGGDAISTLKRAKIAADKAGWTKEQWEAYVNKATAIDYTNFESGGYRKFLEITMDYFDWEKGKELPED